LGPTPPARLRQQPPSASHPPPHKHPPAQPPRGSAFAFFERVAVVTGASPAIRLINAVREWTPRRRRCGSSPLPPRGPAANVRPSSADERGDRPETPGPAFEGSPYLLRTSLRAARCGPAGDRCLAGLGFCVPEKCRVFRQRRTAWTTRSSGRPAEVMRLLGDQIESSRLAEMPACPPPPPRRGRGGPVADLAAARDAARVRSATRGWSKATAGGATRHPAGPALPNIEAFERGHLRGVQDGTGDATVPPGAADRGGRPSECRFCFPPRPTPACTVWTLCVRDCSVASSQPEVLEIPPHRAGRGADKLLPRGHAAELARAAGYVKPVRSSSSPERGPKLLSFQRCTPACRLKHRSPRHGTAPDIVKLQLHPAAGGHLPRYRPLSLLPRATAF